MQLRSGSWNSEAIGKQGMSADNLPLGEPRGMGWQHLLQELSGIWVQILKMPVEYFLATVMGCSTLS